MDGSLDEAAVGGPVRVLRLAVTAQDKAQAVRFYRDVLSLPQLADFSSAAGSVVLLDAGRATLELVDERQADLIDEVEVGRRIAPPIRVALRVADTAGTTEALAAAGAQVVAEPVRTPWNSSNARLQAPAGLQLTLFQELGPVD